MRDFRWKRKARFFSDFVECRGYQQWRRLSSIWRKWTRSSSFIEHHRSFRRETERTRRQTGVFVCFQLDGWWKTETSGKSSSMRRWTVEQSVGRSFESMNVIRSSRLLDLIFNLWSINWNVKKMINWVSMLWPCSTQWQRMLVRSSSSVFSSVFIVSSSCLAVDSVILESVCLTVKASVRDFLRWSKDFRYSVFF